MWPLGVFRSVLLSCFAGGGGQDHTGGMGYMYMGEYTHGVFVFSCSNKLTDVMKSAVW